MWFLNILKSTPCRSTLVSFSLRSPITSENPHSLITQQVRCFLASKQNTLIFEATRSSSFRWNLSHGFQGTGLSSNTRRPSALVWIFGKTLWTHYGWANPLHPSHARACRPLTCHVFARPSLVVSSPTRSGQGLVKSLVPRLCLGCNDTHECWRNESVPPQYELHEAETFLLQLAAGRRLPST